MMKIILAATAALALATVSAQAETCDPKNRTETGKVCFKDTGGNMWIVTEGGNNADPSALHMSPDAAKACPTLRVKLEASKLGPKMTKEQKFRSDARWHMVCDRSQPQQAAK